MYIDDELIVDEIAESEHTDLGAALMAPPTAAAEVHLTAGTPAELRFEYDLAGRTGLMAELLWLRFGTEPAVVDSDVLIAAAAEAAGKADVALVVVGTNSVVESEGYDRTSLALPGRQDDLVRAVAAANPHTVVLVNAGSPVLMPWRDQVAAVLVGYFGGQEFGHAVADMLLGTAEPGGRLPTTWPAAEADVPVMSTAPVNGALDYAEGIHIGYRAWLKQDAAPAYWFGSGQSYTDIAVTGVDAPASVTAGEALPVTVEVENRGTARRQADCADLRGARGLRRRPPGALAGRLRARARTGRGESTAGNRRANTAAGLLAGRLALRARRLPIPGRHLGGRPAAGRGGGAHMRFPNPLIPGFNPDPSVVLADGVYYLALPFTTRVLGVEVTVAGIDLTDCGIIAICSRKAPPVDTDSRPPAADPPAGCAWIAAHRHGRGGAERVPSGGPRGRPPLTAAEQAEGASSRPGPGSPPPVSPTNTSGATLKAAPAR